MQSDPDLVLRSPANTVAKPAKASSFRLSKLQIPRTNDPAEPQDVFASIFHVGRQPVQRPVRAFRPVKTGIYRLQVPRIEGEGAAAAVRPFIRIVLPSPGERHDMIDVEWAGGREGLSGVGIIPAYSSD